MAPTGWVRWALIASVLLVAPAATCHHSPPNPPGGGLTSNLPSPLRAGVAKVTLSLPAGTPLAGYGSAARRMLPPDPNPFDGFTYFKPNTGQMDPLYAKALVMTNATTKVAIVTVDAVGVLSDLVDRIHANAVSLGATIPRENLVVSASHTHSGPGSQTKLRFWEMMGTDLLYPPFRDAFVNDCADALFNAEQNLQLAKFGSASGLLAGVTVNRRVGISPTATPTTSTRSLASSGSIRWAARRWRCCGISRSTAPPMAIPISTSRPTSWARSQTRWRRCWASPRFSRTGRKAIRRPTATGRRASPCWRRSSPRRSPPFMPPS